MIVLAQVLCLCATETDTSQLEHKKDFPEGYGAVQVIGGAKGPDPR